MRVVTFLVGLVVLAGCSAPPSVVAVAPPAAPDIPAVAVAPVAVPVPADTPATLTARPQPCAAIYLAARRGNDEQLRVWRDAGVDLDCDAYFATPLGLAAGSCDTQAVTWLLAFEADPNVCVPLSGKTTCGSSGGLDSQTHSRYPLGIAEERLSTAVRNADAERVAECQAVFDLIAPLTGRIPEDLRPAKPLQ